MAMIRKRGPRRYQAVIKLGRDGRHGIRRKTFTSRSAANKWIAETEAELRAAGPGTAPDPQANSRTLGHYLWLALDTKAGKCGITPDRKKYPEERGYEFHQWYRDTVRMVEHPLMARRLSEITAEHLRDYLAERKAAGVKPATLRRHDWNAIRAAYKEARSKRGTDTALKEFYRLYGLKETLRPLARDVDPERVERSEALRRIPREVERRLLNACTDWRMWAAMVLSVETAVRRSELLRLDWSEVDISRREIRLSKDITKTRKARSVKLSRRAVGALEELRRASRHHPEYSAAVIPYTVNAHTLAWKRTKRRAIKLAEMEAELIPAADLVETAPPDGATEAADILSALARVRWHDFRHTAISRWLDTGLPLHIAAAMSGHTTTVINQYAHGEVADALDYIDKAPAEPRGQAPAK